MARGFDDSWRDFKPPPPAGPPAGQAATAPKPRHKYRATPTVVEGVRFDSTKEAEHWQALQLRAKAGAITGLSRQRPFALVVTRKSDGLEQVVGSLVMDFVYWEGEQLVCEDVKSKVTREIALYKWKRKHFESQYGLVIREV